MTEEIAYKTIGNTIRRIATPKSSRGVFTLDDLDAFTEPLYYANSGLTVNPPGSAPVTIWGAGDTFSVLIYDRPAVQTHGQVITAERHGVKADFPGVTVPVVSGTRASNPRHIQWKQLFGSSGPVTISFPGGTEEDISKTFTALADLAVNTPSVIQHVWYLFLSTKLRYGKQLAHRILEIEEALKEDQEEPITLDAASLQSLIEFLEANPRVARPQLAASRTGYLIAKWAGPERRKMVIHFYADGKAEYCQFAPNPKHSDKQDLDTSLTTADALGAKLARIGAFAWMK